MVACQDAACPPAAMPEAGYDYVVVGAGSAGCVLAGRLTEDPDVRVCLIESGPAVETENIRVPLYGGRLFRTELDWDYDSHPEPACDARRIYLPRGRVLGGTSAMNGMVYIRGSRADYDGWRQPGWSFAELLPYFKRSEDNQRGAGPYHGVGGPLAVSDGRYRSPGAEAFVAAAVAAGYPANPDFNGPCPEGFGAYQVNQRDGERCSAARAFLQPALGRPNLTVQTGLTVHRICLRGGRATGVAGRRLDQEVEIRADREVILAAGAYNSPQLLLLSGIGPADQLRGLGIEVMLDQPLAGQNLQDHPQVWLVFGHSAPVSLLLAGEPEQQRRYAEQRRGPLASNGPETGGFVTTGAAAAGPDLQFTCLPSMFVDCGLTPPTGHGISYGGCVLSPAGRGSVTLASADPTAKPRIAHRYYTEPADLATAVAGLRIGLELARQPALQPYLEHPVSVPESGADADLRAFARRHTATLFHPAGTCAIGTVVDAELRVRGVAGLRVADASVMPTVPRGNTNAPVIAIAEKAADLLRGLAPPPAEDPLPAKDSLPGG